MMPTYEYRCQECGHLFEVFQAITENPLKKCPVCRGSVKRLISSGAGLIFKGSGFYITDYKKKEQSRGKVEKKEEKKDQKSEGLQKKDGGEKKESSTKE
jgi:putative FmdB family regulatory protein